MNGMKSGCGKGEGSTRRNFLFSAGGLFALSAVLGCRMAKRPAFSERSRHLLMNLAYQRVEIGLEKPFSVLHISDTHLSAAYADETERIQSLSAVRTKAFGGCQEEALWDALAYAKDSTDFVLHTGDLIDFQSRANLDIVHKIFGEDVIGCLGNHEFWPGSIDAANRNEAFKRSSRGEIANAYRFDPEFNSRIVNGVDFVMIDDVFGTVTESVVGKFKEEVSKGLPIVLCMHVPFISPGIWMVHEKYWRGAGMRLSAMKTDEARGDYLLQLNDSVTQEFIRYLKSVKQLKAILTGHHHLTFQEPFSPTAVQFIVGGNFMFYGQEILFT